MEEEKEPRKSEEPRGPTTAKPVAAVGERDVEEIP